jgi:cysteinyl-tRNA synthetase
MSLLIHNTLSGKKEEFQPLVKGQVGMYVCGITPYDYTHLGHGRCYITFDLIHRYLKHKGYQVKYIQNITDIDDKIIKKSQKLKITPRELTDQYIEDYFKTMDTLGVQRADLYPRATEHIDEMIKLVETLLKKEYAYQIGGDVYFSVRKFAGYGQLSRRSLQEMKSGSRVEIDPRKKDPLDFVLWKTAKPGEPFWESPWGAGRPGWHLECSVMSAKYLGQSFDLHGGGQDLIFPHHENERAQSESANDKLFVKYWVHNGFVTVNSEKMSKSSGNIFSLKEILSRYSPEVIRLFLISQHYRHPLDFSLEALNQVKSGWERLVKALENAQFLSQNLPAGNQVNPNLQRISEALTNDFYQAMDDDFNTARALASVYNLVNILYLWEKDKPAGLTGKDLQYMTNQLVFLLGLWGINVKLESTLDERVRSMIEEREHARQTKNWIRADEIRQNLEREGIILEDTAEGTRWRKK